MTLNDLDMSVRHDDDIELTKLEDTVDEEVLVHVCREKGLELRYHGSLIYKLLRWAVGQMGIKIHSPAHRDDIVSEVQTYYHAKLQRLYCSYAGISAPETVYAKVEYHGGSFHVVIIDPHEYQAVADDHDNSINITTALGM